ncbi:MAG: ABC transporter permease [Clostridiales bacterium]|nr:ABC transporter permease [Clostridiales bacterium]
MSFKSFIKIFKTKIPLITMYVGIFLMISLINTQVGGNNKSTGYVNANIKVAVIDNDNSELSKGLTTFLKENTKAVDIIETEEGMEDALFERVAEYIVIIPKNYENDLMAGKNVSLESKKVPDAYSAVYAENLINQYITTYKTYYVQYGSEKSISEIINKTNDSMKSHINVEMKNNNKASGTNRIENNFNFGAYVILACIIWGVAEVLSTFFNKNIADRINVSPVRNTKKNLSLVCYSLFYMIIVYFINVIIDVAIFRGEMFNKINIMRLGNMLCLAMVAAGIGFLISTTIKSKGGRAAAINVVALGFSFISGAFVPIEYISDGVIKIAEFLPVYWYIKANRCISEMFETGIGSNMGELMECIGIQLLFFLAIVSISMVIRKRYTRQITG